jgi:WD40 repeat protein
MKSILRARPPLRIFINYRREDASGYAGWLYEALSARYGESNVFMDVDTILPGEDFHEVLGSSVAACDVLVALIGRDWLTVAANDGKRRIDHPDDWVRIEIESALSQGVKIIPTLVDGARPLAAADLPESLAPLATRQTVELTSARWRYDVGRLVGAIDKNRGSVATSRPRGRRRLLPLAGAGAAAASAVAVVVPLLLLTGGGGPLGKPGQIAFARNDGLYRMNADGSGVRRLFETGQTVSRPTWSPDAKHVAFAQGGDIWRLDSGGKVTNLTKEPSLGASSPTWSPDGKQIAFAAADPSSSGHGGIAVVSAAGGSVRFLLDEASSYEDGSPAWSPDGKTVAFTTRRGKPLELDIYSVSVRDGNLSALVYTKPDANAAVYNNDPSWSPDGKAIAFDTNDGTQCFIGCKIETLTIATGRFTTVAVPGDTSTGSFVAGYGNPKWIDGSTVLFTYKSQVWKVGVKSGTPEQVGTESDVLSADVARAPGR